MSAFAGGYNRDGRPIDPTWRNCVPLALAPRRLSDWWRAEDSALAGAGMAGPLPEYGGLVVAADVRLDNRADLLAMLHLDPSSSPDCVLIAAAYRRWGEDCPSRLLGDFAFLLWDPARQIMFGARDHLGVRPFYYHLSNRRLAAATTTRALLAMGVDDSPDEAGLADFVAGAFADTTISLYRDIKRLPPGHSLTVGRHASRISQYWQLHFTERYTRPDAAEQFRALFEEAVRSRLTGPETAGVMLSGGLDSSAISAVAGRLRAAEGHAPLQSYSMTFKTLPDWNEGPFIDEVLADGTFKPTMIPSDNHDPFGDIDTILSEQDGPFLAYNHSVSRQLYHAARASGVSILLNGHGGDEVVSHGMGRLNELAMAGEWKALWREAGGIAALHAIPTWQVVAPYTGHMHVVRSARWYWNDWKKRLGDPTPPRSGSTESTTHSLVAPGLAARIDIAGRQSIFRPTNTARQTEDDLHLAALTSPIQPYALEVLDRAAAAAGVTARYPFFDRRLVEFCLSLPSHEKLNQGQPRHVLRQAMRGILPEAVRLRRDKFDFGGQLAAGFVRHRAMLTDMIEKDVVGLDAYVDMDVARKALNTVLAKGAKVPADAILPLWRVAVLAKWLGRTDNVTATETLADAHRTRALSA
jgi:asparagine synthase (glutamine-hydrolysing)